MNLDHIGEYARMLEEAGIDTHDQSPLLLPSMPGMRGKSLFL